MAAREHAIQCAIADHHAGVYKSLRAAGKAYNVPEATLRGRLRGVTRRVLSHHHQQRLAPEQENYLIQWILDEDRQVQPPSHARVRGMATQILIANGDTASLGKIWVTNFLQRQPHVASVVGRSIEVSRADAGKLERIRVFLDISDRTRRELAGGRPE